MQLYFYREGEAYMEKTFPKYFIFTPAFSVKALKGGLPAFEKDGG